MTKKTDALIFRYGIKTIWKNTNFLFKTSVANSFFFKFLKFELKRRNFDLISIEQKKQNIISIFLFCFLWNVTFSNPLVKKFTAVFIFKLILFYKLWFLLRVLYTLFKFFILTPLSATNTLVLFYLPKVTVIFSYKQDYLFPTNSTLSLQQLFLKVEQLKLEMELSIVFNRNFYLKLHNVFNLPLYFDFIQLIRNKIEATTPSLGTLEFMFYLSCKLKNTSIIASFLAQSLELENRHRRVLWSTINIVKFLRRQLFLFKSIRIYITGKLNGKMRRKTYGFKLGRLAVQQINTNLSYFKATSFTKFGTISVKVWMFF